MSKLKWNYATTYLVAQTCKTRSEFSKKYGGAYRQARKNKWLNDYTWFISTSEAHSIANTKWTYDKCYNIAKNCTTRSELLKKYSSVYDAARKNKWLDAYTWFIPSDELYLKNTNKRIKWTYDACYTVAKTCVSYTEFSKKYGSAFTRAYKQGWLNDYTWFISKSEALTLNKTKWSKDKIYELAKTCNSKIELKNKNNQAYNIANKNGWINDYTWFIPTQTRYKQVKTKYTYDICKLTAYKYNTLKDFREKEKTIYRASIRNKWLSDFNWLAYSKLNYNNMDNVYAYYFNEYNTVYIGRTIDPKQRHLEHCTSNKSAVYKFVKLNNLDMPNMTIIETNLSILDGCKQEDYYCKKYKKEGWKILNKGATGIHSSSIGNIKNKWTKHKCYTEAKKYTLLSEFRKNSYRAYNVSIQHKWINDYNWLIRSDNNPKCIYQYTLNNEYITKFDSINAAAKFLNKSSAHIRSCCMGKRNTAYGYIWKYETDVNKEKI